MALEDKATIHTLWALNKELSQDYFLDSVKEGNTISNTTSQNEFLDNVVLSAVLSVTVSVCITPAQ